MISARSVAPFLIFLALASATAAQAESLVILEARGVSGFQPGASIDSGRALHLNAGQHLSLISQSGNSITLDGPFNGVPTAAGKVTSQRSIVASLFTEQQARTSEVGTTRAKDYRKIPGPWLIDVGHSGDACISASVKPVFWRPSAANTVTVTVMPNDRSWRAVATWPAGRDRIELGSGAPLRPGWVYFVALNGAEVAIRLHDVPATLVNDSMRTTWMVDEGCEQQAEALSRAHG
jgi:hypothetical protein